MNNITRIGRFLQFHKFFSLIGLFWILECYMQEELLLLRLLLLCPKAVLRSISLSDLGLGLLSPTFYLSTGYSKWICFFHKELSPDHVLIWFQAFFLHIYVETSSLGIYFDHLTKSIMITLYIGLGNYF